MNMRKLKRTVICMATAAAVLLPLNYTDRVYAVSEDNIIVPCVNVVCLTPAEEILPGSTVTIQITAWIDELLYHDEWANLLYPEIDAVSDGGLMFDEDTELTINDPDWFPVEYSMDNDEGSLQVMIYVDDGNDVYNEMLLMDGELIITYPMRVSGEVVSGQELVHTVTFKGKEMARDKETSCSIRLTVAESPDIDEPEEPELLWSLKVVAEESIKTSFRRTYRFMEREV